MNVGIGTTNPVSKLNVVGGAIETNDQYRLAGYTLAFRDMDDRVKIGGGTGGLAFLDSGGNVSALIDNNGNVGIGTLNPVSKLNVVGGAIETNDQYRLAGYTLAFRDMDDRVKIGGGTGGLAFLDSGGNVSALIDNNGNVGIGNTTPGKKLVVGNNLHDSGDGIGVDGVLAMYWGSKVPKAGLGESFRWYKSHEGLRFDFESGTTMSIGSNGKVGIGTTNPDNLLSVNESIENLGANSGITVGNHSGSATIHLGQGLENLLVIAVGISTDNNRPERSGHGEINTWRSENPLVLQDHGHGNVGIGTRFPEHKLHVWGPALADSWLIPSDARFKTDIRQVTDVLERLSRVNPIYFKWNELYESLGDSTGFGGIGLIAQEVEAEFPELVTTWGDEGYKSIDHGRLTAVLIQAIRELKSDNQSLSQRTESLELRLAERS